MSDNVIIGVNILEELTTGKYRDSRIIFREYIQNACDQIDVAVKTGLLAQGEGAVELWIDEQDRSISIEDNATGIEAKRFKETLYSIGESNKTLGEDKGFRGIGHWCGIGYCKTLVFTSKAQGEDIVSIMTCDAEKMRKMMDEHNSHKAHYTIDDALSATVNFSTSKANNINDHYFKVEMFDVRDVHTELCVLQQVKDYLSFVAPVGYATAFHFRNTIHKHAEALADSHTGDKVAIQEYNVTINGSSIFKKYAPSFTTSKGDDKITEVDFHDFYDDDGNLIAWLWFGISRFQGVLKKENQMRGIRLRTQNIQIGDDNALQKLFSEDRGQHYFVGEVFAISKDLIPNSQRDYFNENEARVKFESLLSNFFNDDLSRIYKAGSNINSKYDKIVKAETIEAEISAKANAGESVSAEDIARAEKLKKEAVFAVQELDKIRKNTENKLEGNEFGTVEVVVSEIIKSNEEKLTNRPFVSANLTNFAVSTSTNSAAITKLPKDPEQQQPVYVRNWFEKVCKIIRNNIADSTAEFIIKKIQEELL